MNLNEITPLILTYNEAPNLVRCLNGLDWAKRIVILDSYSLDETSAIAKRYSTVDFRQRRFDGHAAQWNFGLTECDIRTEWVLALDADYVVSSEFVDEIRALQPATEDSAYRAKFIYCVYGRPLRSGIYPPVAVLFRRTRCRLVQDGHTHRLAVREGRTCELSTKLRHDDWKSVGRWLTTQAQYMDMEVEKLDTQPEQNLSRADRLRKRIYFAPWVVFLYCFFYRGGIWDGWAGWFYAFQRFISESVLSLKLLESRFGSRQELPGRQTSDPRRVVGG